MNYCQIINKINKIMNSCVNKDQIKVGRKYCQLLIDKYASGWAVFDLEDYLFFEQYKNTDMSGLNND